MTEEKGKIFRKFNLKLKIKFNLYIKSVISIIFLLITISLLFSVFFIKHETYLIKQELLRRGEAVVKNLAYNSKAYVFTLNKEILTKLAGGILENEDVEYVIFHDKQGGVLIKKGNNLAIKEVENKSDFSLYKKINVVINECLIEDYLTKKYLTFFDISTPIFAREEETTDDSLIFLPEVEVEKEVIGIARIGISLRGFFQRIEKIKRLIILLTVGIILTASLATVFLVRGVTVPLKKLVSGTRRIIGGDLSQQIEVKRKDELGELTEYFNRMTLELKQKITQITDLNVNLEKKVEERTQELQEAYEKVKESERVKTEFLNTMSHELRTPLNAIIGFSKLLLSRKFGALNSVQTDNMTEIQKGGKYLLEMINELLDFSKIEAGMLNLNKQAVDLGEIADEILPFIKSIVDEKNKSVELKKEIEHNLPLVDGDPIRIRQILINIAGNAVKFTDKGSITVKAVDNKDEFIKVSVIDTGIGIKQEDIPKVFERFVQVDGSSARKYKGTGLGMSIVKQLVDMHGGKIWIESQVGKGSAFHFTLCKEEHKQA